MAIKFEVTPTSQSSTNYIGSAASSKSDVNFGDVIKKDVNLPRESAGANFQSNMEIADSIGKSYKAVSSVIGDVGTMLQAHANLEDQTKGNKLIADLRVKHSTISTKNMERAAKGEITLGQLAEENKLQFEVESRNSIENTTFNSPQIRDKLYSMSNELSASNYEQDIKASTDQIRQETKAGLNLEVADQIKLAGNSPADFTRAEQWAAEHAINDKRVVNLVGSNVFQTHMKTELETTAKNLLSNTIKADPYKAEELLKSGVMDRPLAYLSDAERPLIEQEIQAQKTALENKQRTAVDQASYEKQQELISRSLGGENLTDLEIKNAGLNPAHENHLISLNVQKREAEAKKNEGFVERQKLRAEFNGTGRGFSKAQADEDFTTKYSSVIKEVMSDPNKSGVFIDTVKADYGDIPNAAIRAIDTPPAPGQDKQWVESRRAVIAQHPEIAKDMDPKLTEVADIVATERKMDGSEYSYKEAFKLHTERTDEANSLKQYKINPDLLSKDSPLKDPQKTLSGSEYFDTTDIPLGATTAFNLKAGMIQKTNPGLTEKEVAQRAFESIGYSKTELGNERVMARAPERVFKGQDYDSFKTDVTGYAGRHKIDEFVLEPANKQSPDGKYDVYYMVDTKTHLLKMDETGTAPREFYPTQWQPVSKFEPRSEYQTTPTAITKGADTAQAQVPALAKAPGLLKAIVGVESSNGKNNLNDTSGAFGPYQFVESTGKQYGLKPGDPIEKHHQAAASYWSDLMTKYNGSIDKSIREYSGYFANAKPAGTVIGNNLKGGKIYSIGKQRAEEQYQDYLHKLKQHGFDTTGIG